MAGKRNDTDGIRFSQVVAGALAAVTAALIGSTMGVAGTVVGAGLASVISTVGGALYLRSIQRTREGVRSVRAKVVGRSGDATVLVSRDQPEPGEVVEADTEGDADHPDRPPADTPRPRWPVLVVTTVVAFVLGMGLITGIEWVKGVPLSGGTGTTFGSVVAPHRGSGDSRTEPTGPTSTPTPTTVTESPAPDQTSTTNPTTGSTPPSRDSTVTSTPSVTTTTEPPASSPANPPSS